MMRPILIRSCNGNILVSRYGKVNRSVRRISHSISHKLDPSIRKDEKLDCGEEELGEKKNDEENDTRPLIKRTTIARGANTPQYGRLEFNPDFYSFEKEQKEKINPNVQKSQYTEIDGLDNLRYSQDQMYNTEIEVGNEFLTDDTDPLSLDDTSYERSSTITPSEKRAFQRIFKTIFEKKQSSETLSVFGETFTSQENDDPDEKRRIREDTDQKLNKLLEESYLKNPEQIQNFSSILERYPPALRTTVAKSLGLESSIDEGDNGFRSADLYDERNEFKSEPFGDRSVLKHIVRKKELEKRLEAIRETETQRVETMMRAATTDFHLWKVLEDEVFCLISKLGLEDPHSSTEKIPSVYIERKTKISPPKKSQQAQSLEKPEPQVSSKKEIPLDTLAAKHNVSPLQLYGPLYPYYLLLALRLLDRSFSRPSPLALALLPKIKSLGYISRVLGANTQFYNELLLIYRFRQNDFHGMLRLLEEMELSSLVMNHETLDIVVQLSRVQDRVRQGSQGLGMSMLWSLPIFARGKFGPWRDYLREKLDSKEQSLGAKFPRMRPLSYHDSKYFSNRT